MNFQVGDIVVVTKGYYKGTIGTLDEIELFEGDLEFWIKRDDGSLLLCHENEFTKVKI